MHNFNAQLMIEYVLLWEFGYLKQPICSPGPDDAVLFLILLIKPPNKNEFGLLFGCL
jgi:hypothetical protein